MRQCPQGPAGQDAQPHVKSERQEQCERRSSRSSKSNLASDESMHVCAICVSVRGSVMRQCPQGAAGQDAQPHVCDGEKEEYASVHCERSRLRAAAQCDRRVRCADSRLLGDWSCVISGVLLSDGQPVRISGGGERWRRGGEVDRRAIAQCFRIVFLARCGWTQALLESRRAESNQRHCSVIVTIRSGTCKRRPVGCVVVMCNRQ